LAPAAPAAQAVTVPTSPIVLINRNSGQCVTNPGTSATLNLQMVQKPCSGSLSEGWTMQAVSGGYRIVSRLNGRCLTVQGNSPANGAAVVQYTCNNTAPGQAGQVWTPTANGSWVQLKNSGKCLLVQGASKSSGAKLVQAVCSNSNHHRWTMSPEPLPSRWSGKITFPLVPVAAANMPDGRIVVWSAYDRFKFTSADYGKTYTSIYNPQTGEKTDTLVSNTQHDMFCPGTTMLPDGKLLVNGGSSSAKTSIFDPSTRTWSASGAMSIPRGYQGNTLISNGEVLTLGGSWSGGQGNKHAEVWANGIWRSLTGVPIDQFIGPDPGGIYRADNHLWLLAWSNSWVFHVGPAARMHWIDTKGDGAVIDAGPRGTDLYSINGTAVMYDKGLILKVGGAPGYTYGYGNDQTYRIDINNVDMNVTPPAPPVGVVGVTALAPMVFPRNLHNSVVLPTGQVVTVGGLNTAAVFWDGGAVLMAELWNPATQKATRLSAMKTPRTYHSLALLLLDGRVFVAGGGLCGTCAYNHPDAEILTPPYLLNANGTLAARPVIKTAPVSAKVGTTISVTTDAAVTSFALVRMGAATHSVNNDQRRIPLSISSGNNPYTLTIPSDPGVVPPGNYMLFAMNSAGRPSYAKVVNIR
jgi:galactose oxidase